VAGLTQFLFGIDPAGYSQSVLITASIRDRSLSPWEMPMIALLETNWQLAAVAVAALLLLGWLLLRSRKAKTRARHRAPDALDEGTAPAARNQAFIDAPSSASLARAENAKEPEA
jgi:hypothetical protein